MALASAAKEQRVGDLLRQMPAGGLAVAQELFCTELGYDRAEERLSVHGWPDWVRSALDGTPTILARYKDNSGSFDVIFVRLAPVQHGHVVPRSHPAARYISGRLLEDHPFALFVFSIPAEQECHLVNIRYEDQGTVRRLLRRVTVRPYGRLYADSERIRQLGLSVMRSEGLHLSPLAIQLHHDAVFDAETVANEFLRNCRSVFNSLSADLERQTGNGQWAHGFALQFLRRLMLVYFIQEKCWLGNDAQFMNRFWQAYRESGCREDTFVSEWLQILFFEASCSCFEACSDKWQHFPPAIRHALARAPRLGEGLFRRDELDGMYQPTITDARFKEVFDCLEAHRYTIPEHAPLDQEVAVDPGMIGWLHESLMNASMQAELRGQAGIYYTPRTEIDLMCRLSVVDWLAGHLGCEHRPLLYRAAFALDLREKDAADRALAARDLWTRMRDLLRSVRVVDPACGSGSYLLGMLHVLDELLARANRQLELQEPRLERKRRIIENSLYGVDIMADAVEICGSRLWLQLVGDEVRLASECRSGRVCTDLGLKIRRGDSLVQACYRTTPEQRGSPPLLGTREAPFVWDIVFAEVFGGGRKGFDIVIGNPPYVRQELIRDPCGARRGKTVGDNRRYKAQLARSVYAAWPRTFGYDRVMDRAQWRLDARSDLYIYFYLHSLSLLNREGILCFITSNAWLDVQYGRDLQEFLLTRGRVKLIMANEARRSFPSANVNTVIGLMGSAEDGEAASPASLEHVARFVMLTVPYEQVLRPAIWEAVSSATCRYATAEWRVVPQRQGRLLESGMDPEKRRFQGDKWGGKYLRAPHVYWVVRDRSKEKLVRLGSMTDVRRGITTGANAFFFLDSEQAANWGIEEEFLVPAMKSPRRCPRIWLESDRSAPAYLFLCHRERDEIQGTRALEYIRYGEAEGIHLRQTCRSRCRWYDLGNRSGVRLHCNYLVDQVMRFYASSHPLLASDNFQEIHSDEEPELLAAACNSTICQLSVNVLGRSNFGGGLLKVQTYEVKDLLIPDPLLLDDGVRDLVRSAGLLSLQDPERRALDEVVFDLLGLTTGERDAVCEAVSQLVSTRLSRAQTARSPL
jgi:hypothetical protein